MNFRLNSDDIVLLESLVGVSRALGSDRSLVLHGGGNSSVKLEWRGVDGSSDPALFIKGSGVDLATIDAAGFVPLHLPRVQRLLPPTLLHRDDLMRELRALRLDPDVADPSVETLVHAAIPARFVLHSHADAVLAVTNTPDGHAAARQVWGDSVAVLEYATPGYPLGAAVAGAIQDHPEARAIVVLGHGLFTFDDDATVALDLHLRIVDQANGSLPARSMPAAMNRSAIDPTALSALRHDIAQAIGTPVIVMRHPGDPLGDLHDSDPLLLAELTSGVATPDHVTWTGPRVATDVDLKAYALNYRRYLERESAATGTDMPEVAAAPRAIIDSTLGLVTVGRDPSQAAAVAEIVRHTASVALGARTFGGYVPPSPQHVFELEHWTAQQAKASRRASDLPHAGKVALVTGAASGIGRACAEALLRDGACVVAWDIAPQVAEVVSDPRWLGQVIDVTDAAAQGEAITAAVDRFGGIDIVVPAAGVFAAAQHIAELEPAMWDRSLAINVTAVATLFRLTHPHLRNAVGGGRVVVIASKNVAAPGPGAAAYSASKAALVQLSRVAALEWAADGIRVNVVNPDAVFDTGLWTPELLRRRAEHYGLSIDEYKRRNLLKVEITSAAVGDLVSSVAGPVFDCTTGAQLPIDGGNERVI